MAQDFAKTRPPAAKPGGNKPARTNRPPVKTVSRLNWFISGFLAGVLCLGGGYLGILQYQALHAPPAVAADTSVKKEPEKQPVYDFGFYRELANAEVSAKPIGTAATEGATAPVAKPDPTTQASAENNQNYLLQAGSFQDRQEADERRAKISLLNMPVDIVPGVVSGRTWYRVQVGPFTGRNATDDARRHLSASNIDSIPLLMR